MSIKTLENIVEGMKNQPTSGLAHQVDADILMPSTKSVYYCMLTRFPDPAVVNTDALKQIFRLLQKSVTVPDITLATVDSTNGFSGTSKSYAPSAVEYENTMEIGFNENIDRIILKELFNWSNSILDHSSGLSSFQNYNSRTISADLMVVHTLPILLTDEESMINNMQEVYFFRNIIPTNLPLSAYGNVAKDAAEKVELSVNFKFREMITSLNNDSLKEFALKNLPELVKGSRLSSQVEFNQ